MSAATNFNAANFVTILGAGAEMPPSVCITTSKVTMHGRGAALPAWLDGRAGGLLGTGCAAAAPFQCWGVISLREMLRSIAGRAAAGERSEPFDLESCIYEQLMTPSACSRRGCYSTAPKALSGS